MRSAPPRDMHGWYLGADMKSARSGGKMKAITIIAVASLG
jgi:hypothetical protein